MSKTLVEQHVEDPDYMRLYQQERAIYEVTELLESRMRELGVSRTELARRLGKTRGWVTQLLDGEANKTIRTIADILAVLGQEYRSFSCPIQISNAALPGPVAQIQAAPWGGMIPPSYENKSPEPIRESFKVVAG